MTSPTIRDIKELPEIDAAASAKLLGVALSAFNRMVRDGIIARVSGRHNAYNVRTVIAGFIEHLADPHLPMTPMARHLDISSERLLQLVDDGVITRPDLAATTETRPASSTSGTFGRPRSVRLLSARSASANYL
jgi:hypothetical protein